MAAKGRFERASGRSGQGRPSANGRAAKNDGPKNNGGRHRCRPPLSRRARSRRSSLSRAGRFRGAETRAQTPKGIAKVPRPPGSIHGRSRFRFPRGLPVRAEALAVRLWRFRSRSLSSHPGGHRRPKPLVPRRAGSGAEALVPPGKSMGREALGHCRVRSSRAEARSCPTLSKPKLLSGRWRRADRNPAFRRAGPEPEGPVSGLSGSAGPKTLGSDGRFTKPAAFA